MRRRTFLNFLPSVAWARQRRQQTPFSATAHFVQGDGQGNVCIIDLNCVEAFLRHAQGKPAVEGSGLFYGEVFLSGSVQELGADLANLFEEQYGRFLAGA